MEDIAITLLPLFKQLSSIAPINEILQVALLRKFKIETIPKNTILLHEGAICKQLWFLVDGVLRSYHNIGEKEITSRIMFTHHIVISAGSFFTQSPSTESIQALNKCVVAKLSFIDLQNLYKKYPALNYHTRIITEKYFYMQEQRLYMLRKHNAKEKYAYFLENYGNYLEHIPQKYIASFLGIAPETLSRMRSSIRIK